MSFITKRERVFNEYDLFELPSRNEGKLKAYASCTDARAWSHFCSDKTEHLVEIIKRNNETCRPKYVPTDVIVDTIMVAKNAEIARLRHKIEEFEQMLAAYDQLELSCDQKCEIAKAHAAIKAANKELDDLCLDLDLSGYTEGIDSDAFETGKSRGDEPGRHRLNETPRSPPRTYETRFEMDAESPRVESVGVQMDVTCLCDASTNAQDKRIDEMQDIIITKDAKLNAMKNTIAVMENDVCEPYCVYAHIYTALEKIFAVLCQNDKYREYLNLLTAGKNTRSIDIKGKILYKLKVLEKFGVALISPCSQECQSVSKQDCTCFHLEVSQRVETFALTSSESKPKPSIDNKRAQLVADIIENEEMKEILSKDNSSLKEDDEQVECGSDADTYCIDTENLKRLKELQENFDDLMLCYETLKHEKECLQIRCHKYEELEKEIENLKCQLREYNSLWNEKEHYRKRSADLDNLKEQYLILTDEALNLETKFKAEAEINSIRCKSIDELRNENVLLEKKINDSTIAFEKEKNALLCQLQAADCKIMCQGQQIRSLSTQIDKLLEQDHERDRDGESQSIVLLDEVETLKEQIKNLKDAMVSNGDEKQRLQNEFEDKLNIINQLRMEIEDWKSTYEKTFERNDFLEKYTESFRDEFDKLIQENKILTQDVEEKSIAVENLLNVINNKSQDVKHLMIEVENKTKENKNLMGQIEEIRENYNDGFTSLENEKKQAMHSLQLARQESQELLDRVKDYDDIMQKEQDISKYLETQVENLKMDLVSREDSNSILLQEIQRLREINKIAVASLTNLNEEKNQYKESLDLTKKESEILKDKLNNFENLTQELRNLQLSHESVIDEKNKLEHELLEKEINLNNALHSIDLTKKESDELIDRLQKSELMKDNLLKLDEAYTNLSKEKHALQKELFEKNTQLNKILHSLNNLKDDNEQLRQKCMKFDCLEHDIDDLKKSYEELLQEKNMLLGDFDNKTQELNNLHNMLENKIEENNIMSEKYKSLETKKFLADNSIKQLLSEKNTSQTSLGIMKKKSADLIDKIRFYENLESEFNNLKTEYDQMKIKNENIQKELDAHTTNLQKIEEQNLELHSHSQNLLRHSEDLENALITTRKELIKKSSCTRAPYEEILNEIADLKKEKILGQQKIRELRDKLDESENTITDLSEDILTRDDRIALLENHINALQDEVRRLQTSLTGAVDVGEQIKDFSYKKIDNSLKSIEAHHSRATHNMKMELAKLQHENTILEKQISMTKLRSDEFSRDNHKRMSQIMNMQNEREIIVADIKQLELTSVGDSELSPDSCSVEEVLASLDRIRKVLDARQIKSISLEQTLLKVQNSSQLLLSKADEAKQLVEKEKQKTINEKEEALRDKRNMENQLYSLKEKLHDQISKDTAKIKDLEAEILNQKLIFDKINKLNHETVDKLKEKLQSLENLYQNSVVKIEGLQNKIQTISTEKETLLDTLKKTKQDFEDKSEEVNILVENLQKLKKKPELINIEVQAKNFDISNREVQTDHLEYDKNEPKDKKESEDIINLDPLQLNTLNPSKRHTEPAPKQKPQILNEVQVLTANVEPTFDFVRNTYLNYKIQKLSPGKLEQYSIPCITDESNEDSRYDKHVLVDIFDKHSMHTNSSKGVNDIMKIPTDSKCNQNHQQPMKGSNVESGRTINKQKDSKMYAGYVTRRSKDGDLFIIYKDSDSEESNENKETWSTNGNSEIVVKTRVKKPKGKGETTYRRYIDDKAHKITKDDSSQVYLENLDDDDSVKQKLKINLPRVDTAPSSLVSLSVGDQKSLNFYTKEIYLLSKQRSTSDIMTNDETVAKKILKNYNTLPTVSKKDSPTMDFMFNDDSPLNKVYYEMALDKHKSDYANSTERKSNRDDSYHKLSRIGANSVLLKTEHKASEKETPDSNFGLLYTLDSIQSEIDPNNYPIAELRKSRSDNGSAKTTQRKVIESSPSQTQLKVTSIPSNNDYKSISTLSKTSEIQRKGMVDRYVMVKLNSNQDYEDKINQLTIEMRNMEKDYKKKIEAIKVQYDRNIKSIINEHNEGVKSIQGLHEETLQDIFKVHENEVENLRSMSIEAMRKVDKLEKEYRSLKTKTRGSSSICLDEDPTKISTFEIKKRKKSRCEKTLTKTTIEAFNVKPKNRTHGPCTCSLDINLSDTIRNIFEQVDVDQRKMAEHTYVKYLANKIINGNIEALDAQELAFLHLKVCRMWKSKLNKEEAFQKKIDVLETELMNKQRNAQQHIAELDRKVAEERRRLQEVREAVCRNEPQEDPECSAVLETSFFGVMGPVSESPDTEKEFLSCNCSCNTVKPIKVGERLSAGDVAMELANAGLRPKRPRNDNSRAVLAKLDVEERRDKKMYSDELPTRLRKSHDRPPTRPQKK